jgi:hypothetical protein
MSNAKGPGRGPRAAADEQVRVNLIISREADPCLFEFVTSRLGDTPRRQVARRFKSLLLEMIVGARTNGPVASPAPAPASEREPAVTSMAMQAKPGINARETPPALQPAEAPGSFFGHPLPPPPPAADEAKPSGLDMTQLDGVELPEF